MPQAHRRYGIRPAAPSSGRAGPPLRGQAFPVPGRRRSPRCAQVPPAGTPCWHQYRTGAPGREGSAGHGRRRWPRETAAPALAELLEQLLRRSLQPGGKHHAGDAPDVITSAEATCDPCQPVTVSFPIIVTEGYDLARRGRDPGVEGPVTPGTWFRDVAQRHPAAARRRRKSERHRWRARCPPPRPRTADIPAD